MNQDQAAHAKTILDLLRLGVVTGAHVQLTAAQAKFVLTHTDLSAWEKKPDDAAPKR